MTEAREPTCFALAEEALPMSALLYTPCAASKARSTGGRAREGGRDRERERGERGAREGGRERGQLTSKREGEREEEGKRESDRGRARAGMLGGQTEPAILNAAANDKHALTHLQDGRDSEEREGDEEEPVGGKAIGLHP